MMPPSTPKEYLKGALRGIGEGAAYGFAVLLFKLARAWWSGALQNEAPPSLGEIAAGVAFVVGGSAFVFGVGRAISGGWIGSMTGAVVLGLFGLWLGVVSGATLQLAFLFARPGESIHFLGATLIFAVGAVVGAILGAIAERAIRQRRGVHKVQDNPGGEGPPA